jgi:hypothetical protein
LEAQQASLPNVTTSRVAIGSSTVALGGLLANSADLAGTEFDFKLTGQAFEEMIVEAGDLQVHPGPYTLSGRIKLQAGMLTLEKFALDRENGDLRLDLELGLPVSRRWAKFDLSGRGKDIRTVIVAPDNFEANAVDFSLRVTGKLRGSCVGRSSTLTGPISTSPTQRYEPGASST